MDTNINESCKEAWHEGVRVKFVKLKESTNGKRLVLIGDPILRLWSKCGRTVACHVAEASAAKFGHVACLWQCRLRKGLPGTLPLLLVYR